MRKQLCGTAVFHGNEETDVWHRCFPRKWGKSHVAPLFSMETRKQMHGTAVFLRNEETAVWHHCFPLKRGGRRVAPLFFPEMRKQSVGLGLPAWALTFLLAARGALLLQQALAVEGGQRGGRVLLDSWVGLGERVHRAGRAVRQACCAESSVQGRHTWEHLSNFTKNPTIEKRNCTCSLVLSESRWYYTTLTTTAVHAARHFTKWDWGQRNTTLASGSLQHKGCTVKWNSHAACYWQVLQLRAPESLSAHPPWHLCFCSGCLRLAVWDLFDLCPCEMATGKSSPWGNPFSLTKGFSNTPSQHPIRSVLLIHREPWLTSFKPGLFQLNYFIMTLLHLQALSLMLVVERWTVMLFASTLLL